MAEILHKQKIKFGFGGIAKIGQGIIPANSSLDQFFTIDSYFLIFSISLFNFIKVSASFRNALDNIIYKFRTMVKDADKIGPAFTVLGDTRITKVGKFLRKTSLDEIPQLFNIIKGEMSSRIYKN